MSTALWSALIAGSLFVGMLLCLEAGYRIGPREGAASSAASGVGPIQAAIFALLGLLLAFAFAGATSRLEVRRQLIVEEANAIETAYRRVDLIPAGERGPIQALFRDYLDLRLRAEDQFGNPAGTDELFAQASAVWLQIWTRVIVSSERDDTSNIERVLLPALNTVGDVATARDVSTRARLPTLILALLVLIALLSALLAGYAMIEGGRRSLLHVFLFAATVSLTLYTVLDLDNPRVGLIHLDSAEQALQRLAGSLR